MMCRLTATFLSLAAGGLVSCQMPLPTERAESGAVDAEAGEPVSAMYRTGVNKFHCSGSMVEQAAPANIQLPSSLKRMARHVLLQDANTVRHGASCHQTGYTHLKLPEAAFSLKLLLSDRAPIRYDAVSVTFVGQPSFRHVYHPGTRVVEMKAYFTKTGEILDMLPIELHEFTVVDQRPARVPEGARGVRGLIEEAKVQSFISSL